MFLESEQMSCAKYTRCEFLITTSNTEYTYDRNDNLQKNFISFFYFILRELLTTSEKYRNYVQYLVYC